MRMSTGDVPGVSRRELLAAAAGGITLALGSDAAPAAPPARGFSRRLEFHELGPGEGWGRGWRSVGVANIRREGGEGVLEAGSDVFPNDPRPVVFAVDRRFREGSISAEVTRAGVGPGVVVRRASPRAYYAAILEVETPALVLARRLGSDLVPLARADAAAATDAPFELSLRATGSHPTSLEAVLRTSGGREVRVSARDGARELQRPGDAGVLATAQTLLPSGSPLVPALGNLHLLPYAVQEGQAFIQTPAGQAFVAEIRRRSTVGFGRIVIESPERPRRTRPSVVAATTGAPFAAGARLQVAADLPAEVWLELSLSPGFRRKRIVRVGRTGAFEAVTRAVHRLPSGRRVYWRARLRRRGRSTRGPVRSFRVLPRAGGRGRVRLAVASCGTQFGPIFDHLAARRPDVLIWQGDLNYPDTHGPLAQTTSGYAGIWRDFLANPRLAPVLTEAAFAAQRDDHDYGVQDANSTNLAPWALPPWGALMCRRLYYRFAAGPVEVWVLNQRQFKSDPSLPDSPDKTLLGARQRSWLLRTLARSPAPFKLICSPVTLFLPGNARDGGWSTGFTSERDLLMAHIAEHVSGQAVFVTGDTHLTAVYERDGRFEARASPLDIPRPNDITLVDPLAAERLRGQPGTAYAASESHFALVEVAARGRSATLDLALVREDGATPYTKRFEQPYRPRRS
jgi:PhoD-like phosphatase